MQSPKKIAWHVMGYALCKHRYKLRRGLGVVKAYSGMIFHTLGRIWIMKSGVSPDLGVSNYLASARNIAQRGRE